MLLLLLIIILAVLLFGGASMPNMRNPIGVLLFIVALLIVLKLIGVV
jgi:hypothetical protein